MISVGENKSILCKGDFHPAQLYKGDKKIAGYTTTEFGGEGGVTLKNCYNDNLHNAVIHGNSVQDGTPTPETPIEVQSVGGLIAEGEYAGKYKVSIKASGENGQTQIFDIFLDEPLRKIGDYADYVDFDKGVVLRNIAKTILTGKEPLYLVSSGTSFPYFFCILSENDRSVIDDICLSTHFDLQTNFSVSRAGDNKFRVYYSSVNGQTRIGFRLVIDDETITDVNVLKEYLVQWHENNTPVTFYYAVPPEQSTSDTVILPNLPTFKGTTIYEIDTNVTAQISGKYKRQEVE